MVIDYDEDSFSVIKEKDYGDSLGKFRIIRYDTGYYALQRYNINDFKQDTDSVYVWETMCISPEQDDPLNPNRVWNLCLGKLTMESLLLTFEDSYKLQNNELMELRLNLNPELDEEVNEEIVKIIKTSEGNKIYDAIMQSIHLQDSYVEEYYKNQHYVNNFHMCIILFLVICIGFLLCHIFIGGV